MTSFLVRGNGIITNNPSPSHVEEPGVIENTNARGRSDTVRLDPRTKMRLIDEYAQC